MYRRVQFDEPNELGEVSPQGKKLFLIKRNIFQRHRLPQTKSQHHPSLFPLCTPPPPPTHTQNSWSKENLSAKTNKTRGTFGRYTWAKIPRGGLEQIEEAIQVTRGRNRTWAKTLCGEEVYGEQDKGRPGLSGAALRHRCLRWVAHSAALEDWRFLLFSSNIF